MENKGRNLLFSGEQAAEELQNDVEYLSMALRMTLAMLKDYAPKNDGAIDIQLAEAERILRDNGCSPA